MWIETVSPSIFVRPCDLGGSRLVKTRVGTVCSRWYGHDLVGLESVLV